MLDRGRTRNVENREKEREKREEGKRKKSWFFWRCWSLLAINSGRPTNRPPTVFSQGSIVDRVPSLRYFDLKGKEEKKR